MTFPRLRTGQSQARSRANLEFHCHHPLLHKLMATRLCSKPSTRRTESRLRAVSIHQVVCTRALYRHKIFVLSASPLSLKCKLKVDRKSSLGHSFQMGPCQILRDKQTFLHRPSSQDRQPPTDADQALPTRHVPTIRLSIIVQKV